MNRQFVGALAVLLTLVALPAQAAPGDTLTQSVQKGINHLVPDVVAFSRGNSCQACHRQGAALFGSAMGKASGYAVNISDSNGLGYLAWHAVREQQSNGRWTNGGGQNNSKTSYAFFGLAGYDKAVGTRYSQHLVKAAEWSRQVQTSAGYWAEDHGSFPTTYGHVPVTARMMVGIAQAKNRVDSNTAALYEKSLARAAQWLRNNRDNRQATIMAYNFQLAWALLGLEAAGAPPADGDVKFIEDRLLGAVSKSTGRAWGYTANHAADEFNTGLALYALCRSGVKLREDQRILQAANWLRDRQRNDGRGGGYWTSSSFSSYDIPTTFAILGLSCYGELGVRVAVEGEDRRVLDAHASEPQTLSFILKVENLGAFDYTDSYTLSVQGGLPGWRATVEPASLTLGSGSSGTAVLTLTAPPELPEALPVQYTVTARSQSNAGVTSTVTVTAYTNPPPPTSGQETRVVLGEGAGATVTSFLSPQPLSARVQVKSTGAFITGPGRGVVTFYVAGVAVGTDTDEDGDGVYRIEWMPGLEWTTLGVQDFRAIYSGIDLPEPQTDLLSSLTASTLTFAPKDSDKDGLPDELEGTIGTDPLNPDTDGDGLSDGSEYDELPTDPLNPDTDGDGFSDGEELTAGTNPLDPNSLPLPPPTLKLLGPANGTVYTPDEPGAGSGWYSVIIEGQTGGPCHCVITIREGSTTHAQFNWNGGTWSRAVRLPLGHRALTVTVSNRSGTASGSVNVVGVPNAPELLSQPPAIVGADMPTLEWTLRTVPGGVVDVTFDDGIGGGEVAVGTFPADSGGLVVIRVPRPYDCKPIYKFYPRTPSVTIPGGYTPCEPLIIDTTAPSLTCPPAFWSGPWVVEPTVFSVTAVDEGSGVAGYFWQVAYPDGTTKSFSGGPSWGERLFPGLHSVSVQVTDAAGNPASCNAQADVFKHTTAVALEDVTVPFGTPVTMVGQLSDTTWGVSLSGKPLRYWLEGKPMDAIVNWPALLPPGQYPVRVAFDEDDLYLASETVATLTILSTPGKITGGGHLDAGQRNFGFNAQAKEKKGELSFHGQLQFEDKEAGITLHSQELTSLAVSRPYGVFAGTAKVNGKSGYTFVVTVEDQGEPGRDDAFRIRISGPGLSYDSAEAASTGERLNRGNIQIH